MTPGSDMRIPTFFLHIETAPKDLVEVPYLKCQMMKTHLSGDFEKEKVMVVIAAIAAQKQPPSGVSISHFVPKPIAVKICGSYWVIAEKNHVGEIMGYRSLIEHCLFVQSTYPPRTV